MYKFTNNSIITLIGLTLYLMLVLSWGFYSLSYFHIYVILSLTCYTTYTLFSNKTRGYKIRTFYTHTTFSTPPLLIYWGVITLSIDVNLRFLINFFFLVYLVVKTKIFF